MTTGGAIRVGSRWLVAVFCWLTAAYAFVTSSAFAYLQFIRPRVFPWIGQFTDWHALASVAWLAVLALAIAPDLRSASAVSGRGPMVPKNPATARWLAIGCLLTCASAVAWNLSRPVLPALTDGAASVLAGALALTPLLWLAIIDHVQAGRYFRWQRPPQADNELHAFEARLFAAVAATTIGLTLLYAAQVSFALIGRFEPDLLLPGLALGFSASLAGHGAVAAVAFLLIAVIVRLTAADARLQYVALLGTATVAGALAFGWLVGDALSLRGWTAVIAAGATSASITGTWTGLRLRTLSAGKTELDSMLDVFMGHGEIERRGVAVRFLAIAGLALAGALVSALADWDFVLLESSVLAVWICAFALAYRLTPFYRDVPLWVIAVACLTPLGFQVAAGRAAPEKRGALDRYAVHNPSYRVTNAIFADESSGDPSFDRFLRANTGLTDVPVKPIDIDFVSSLAPSRPPKPHIFLFVIDSLRPDYLSPYNPSVKFTPRFEAFARDSIVFTNAFTRYGGTGLSLPAIWTGSAIVHKQYVKPFHPMNALEKLLAANGYRSAIGLDSIMQQLLAPSSSIDELDRGRQTMDYEFCRTLDELATKLDRGTSPVFGYSLPQDIHMSKLPRRVDDGEDYRTFYAPYATKVHAVDGCFGRFVDALKARNLYEHSLIVVTSDHGEMLGEDNRYGHSYHLFPQVVQVPLIVHLPSTVPAAPAVDADAVSLTTDIAPTLYAALGYEPVASNSLMGRSLLAASDEMSTSRRRDSYVLAASYGAVYAVLRHNGRRLYIADAVRGGDQAFERDSTGRWSAVDVSEGLRTINRFAIRQHVNQIGRMYHVR